MGGEERDLLEWRESVVLGVGCHSKGWLERELMIGNWGHRYLRTRPAGKNPEEVTEQRFVQPRLGRQGL